MSTINVLLKALLIVIGLICIVVFLGLFADKSAEMSADEFCNRITIGDNIDKAMFLATEQSIRHRTLENQTLYDFIFQGRIFNADICRIQVSNGKVISRKVFAEGD